jgi:hypothetical protein
MKKALLILMMALAPALAAAQEAKEQQPPQPASLAVKAFEVRPGNLERIWATVRMIVGEPNLQMDRNLNVLIVKAPQQLMPAVEEVVKRLDVAVPPPKNIEFTVYVLEVAREPLPEAGIPPDLQSTVTQLRTALGYQGFRVADKTVVQARAGDGVNFTGRLAGVQPPPAPQLYQQVQTPAGPYTLGFRTKLLTEEKPPVIQLDNFFFNAPPRGELRTSIDIREGQKVVVGKTANDQQTLVLVMSAKLLN